MQTKRDSVEVVDPRSSVQLAEEWDKIGPHRDALIASGRDLSYRHILLPSLLELLSESLTGGHCILDVGCGTGTFISELATNYPNINFTGIDPSTVSIKTAMDRRQARPNCEFKVMSVEDLGSTLKEPFYFDAIIANMLFQNVANLSDVLKSCGSLLKPTGILVFAVSHPCFWPRYWGYDEEPWFEYDKEIWIDAPFKTSLSPRTHLRATHVHRPLHAYINGLHTAGFLIDRMAEPMPDDGVEGAYPVAWEFPRFLIGRANRTD